MTSLASILAARLARDAEGVCRQYLSSGQRNGKYWLVGDVANTPGRSLFVALAGPRAGKWTDAATGEHGDLLDLIRLNKQFLTLRETLAEARAYLSDAVSPPDPKPPIVRNSPAAAKRLFRASVPIIGTLAESYLRSRGITCSLDLAALRFHPACYHRTGGITTQWPALIAAVTDHAGNITGVQRTWLTRDGLAKAPLADPRRALGDILGNAVRFARCDDVLAVGEGIETMLALRSLLPNMPMAAALSANHLALTVVPPQVKHLYIAADNDPAGWDAAERLITRCSLEASAWVLVPSADDWNAELKTLGRDSALANVLAQMHPADAQRYGPAAPLRAFNATSS